MPVDEEEFTRSRAETEQHLGEERVHALSMETKEPLLMRQYDIWESDQAF